MELTAGIIKHEEVVALCKRGHEAGFKTLYTQYAKAMYNTTLRIVNNASDAEDIVQEAFADAFRNIEGFNYESTFGAWMKRIVINKSINHLRSKKFKVVDITETTIADIEEQVPDDSEIMFKVDEIKRAVMRLPDGFRTVFTLAMFEGYDYDEISGILHIKESTVRTQYHRAKKQILNILKTRDHA